MPCILPGMGGSPFSSATTSGSPRRHDALPLTGGDHILPTAIGDPCTEPPSEGDWQEAWELIERSHAIANSVHIAAVNGRDGKEISGFSGDPLSATRSGNCSPMPATRETITATIDLGINDTIRDSWGFFRNRRPTPTVLSVPGCRARCDGADSPERGYTEETGFFHACRVGAARCGLVIVAAQQNHLPEPHSCRGYLRQVYCRDSSLRKG